MAAIIMACLVPASSCFAVEPTHVVERTVVAGVATNVGELYELNADCSPAGDIRVRVTKPPVNGMAESEDAILVPNFPLLNQRAACNKRKNQGVIVTYQSKPAFAGKDRFEIEVIYPRGIARSFRFVIQVKS